MTFTELFDLEPDTTPVDERELWVPAMVSDSRKLVITCERHANKIAYHAYDDAITYWEENGVAGLRRITRTRLGRAISDHLDILARNAFMAGYHCRMPNHDDVMSGGYPQFGLLTETDRFDFQDIPKIRLRMDFDDIPAMNVPQVSQAGDLFAIGSPLTVFQMRQQDEDFDEKLKVADPARMLRYEIGEVYGARFIKTKRNVLFNCGNIYKQAALTANIAAGQGAAQDVDNYEVGQAEATAYIEVSDVGDGTDPATSFMVGDRVTIHKTRTSNYGVTDGVNPTEGTARVRKIVAIDRDNNRLSFDKPLFDAFTAGEAWVTKGLHVHMVAFIGGSRGVVAGVLKPPTVHNPAPFDDCESYYRVAWDAYLKFQQFRSEVLEVYFHAGDINP
jgi:hypothetical protein